MRRSRHALAVFLVFAVVLSSSALGQTGTSPAVEFNSVPAFGSTGLLGGRVRGLNPANYKMAVLIFVPSLGWYSKPYCSPMFVDLQPDGSFQTPIFTGGVDDTLTRIAAYAVPKSFNANCVLSGDGLPAGFEASAAARAIITRVNTAEREFSFSGMTWYVKENRVPLGPGPNYFSASTNNVFLDSQGRLHLKVTNRSGRWSSSEVVSAEVTGLGLYRFVVESPLGTLDPQVVAGFFTWSDDPGDGGHNELDHEASRFGRASDPTNAQVVRQPYTTAGNLMRYAIPSSVTSTIHTINWLRNSTVFATQDAGTLTDIYRWNYTGSSPVPAVQNVRANLWMFNGVPPSNGQEAEVILRSVDFTPVPGTPMISTVAQLPSATALGSYSTQLAASATNPRWTVISKDLPSGLALSPSGALSGAPTLSGTFRFTAQVADANGLTAARTFQIAIAAAPPATLTGRVVDSSGNLLSNATIRIAGPQFETINSVDGTFRSGALPNGDYTIDASRPGYTFATVRVTLTGASQSVTLVGQPLRYKIAGRIRDRAGRGLSGIPVVLGGPVSVQTASATDGTFEFSGLTTGDYTVTPGAPGFTFVPPFARLPGILADQSVDFTADIAKFTLSGRIADSSARGIGDVELILNGPASRRTTTASDGTYQFIDIDAGAYTLTPSKLLFAFSPIQASLTIAGNSTFNFTATPLSDVGAIGQCAAGQGWRTRLVLFNLGTAAVNGQVQSLDNDGRPLSLSITSLIGGGSITAGPAVNFAVPANGTVAFDMDAVGSELAVGWVRVLASGPLSGYAVFRLRQPGGIPDSEGTVLLETRSSSSLTIPFDAVDGFATGVSFVNPTGSSANLSVQVLDEAGGLIGTTTIAMAAQGHLSAFVSDLIPQSQDRRGLVRVQTPGANLIGMGLRFSPFATFTSVPVVR